MEFKPKKCKWCGRLFQNSAHDICADCIKKLDDDFLVARDYIYENPTTNIATLCEDTGIEEREIMHFLREGRLILSSADAGLRCEKCAAPISTGRFCRNCQDKLKNAFGTTSTETSNQPDTYKKDDSDQMVKRRNVMHTFSDKK